MDTSKKMASSQKNAAKGITWLAKFQLPWLDSIKYMQWTSTARRRGFFCLADLPGGKSKLLLTFSCLTNLLPVPIIKYLSGEKSSQAQKMASCYRSQCMFNGWHKSQFSLCIAMGFLWQSLWTKVTVSRRLSHPPPEFLKKECQRFKIPEKGTPLSRGGFEVTLNIYL